MKKFFFLFLIFPAIVSSQISPGDLSRFHSNLEGLSNCTKCHELGKQLTNQKCLACHEEINTRIKNNQGYHSGKEVKGNACWKCHSEHNGRNFKIISFNKNQFKHSLTGFELNGSHSNLDCNKCHKNDFIADSKLKKRKDSYLGLSGACTTCHEDYHQKTLGDNCIACHNAEKFRPAGLFSHDKSKFKLAGMHTNVKCDNCHQKILRSGKLFQKFNGLDFNSCSDCHKDVHAGKFGNDCKSCHNTSGFNSINKNSFDHNKTNFKLIGKHNLVDCSKCHGKDLNSKPKHQKCNDCHKDYHNGDFTQLNKSTDCSDCHTESGFSPSTFTVEKHNDAGFKLVGAHQAIPCKNCHMKNNVWQFRKIGLRCINCHSNVHEKEITPEIMVDSECTVCHNQDSWNKVVFDHDKTIFSLSGKHLLAACRNCHYNKADISKQKFIFASSKSNCENCHTDIHNGQFAKGDETNCNKCHNSENWNPVNFDHSKTRFLLTGKHLTIECGKCHKKAEKNGKEFINYKIEDFRCIVCHS